MPLNPRIQLQLLHSGPLTPAEVQRAVIDKDWQSLHTSLHGQSLERRFETLSTYLKLQNNSRSAQVRVTNYLDTLKRAGTL